MKLGRRLLPLVAFGAGSLLPGCAGPPTPELVLLITIDTCRADRFGCYGGAVATPAVDRLAAEGTLFLQASATAPITLPSHLSILTGLYPDRHGVRDNGAGVLPAEAVTLAEVLRDRGWATAAFLSAVPLDSSFGVDQGFDVYDDDFLRMPDSGKVMTRLDVDQRTATDVTDLALAWLRDTEAEKRPGLVWVHYFDPHTPYTPPAEFAPRYGPAPYDGEVAYVDAQLARLVEAAGPAALVVVVADHGESLGEHDESTHGFFAYESALRVPWVLRGPGVPAGRRVETPVSVVQVLPTILDLLRIPSPEGIDGTSAAPLWEETSADDTPPVFAEALFPRLNFGWSAARSIRSGRWKLIEATEPELYDLLSDPNELHDLASAQPSVTERLLGELHDHAGRGGELIRVGAGPDPGLRQRLEGLGYLGAGGAGGDQGGADHLWDFGRRSPREMIHVFRELEELPQVVLGGTREEANTFVERLRLLDPGNVPVLKRVAKLRLRAGHLDEAAATCREILDHAPDDLETLRTLATVQLQQGDPVAATETIRRSLILDPGDLEGRLLLAAQLRETDRLDEAVHVLREGLAAEPNQVELLNNLAWFLVNGRGDPAEALGYARRARVVAPDDPVVLDTFGWAAVRAGRAGEGVAPLRRALELTGDPEVRAHLGVALSEDGRPADGRPLLEAAVEERADLARIPEVAKWWDPRP